MKQIQKQFWIEISILIKEKENETANGVCIQDFQTKQATIS